MDAKIKLQHLTSYQIQPGQCGAATVRARQHVVKDSRPGQGFVANLAAPKSVRENHLNPRVALFNSVPKVSVFMLKGLCFSHAEGFSYLGEPVAPWG